MTEPKVVRYFWTAQGLEEWEGKMTHGPPLVFYSDYEALAARVEELESGVAFKLAGQVAAQINQKNEELARENKRLREAIRMALDAEDFWQVEESDKAMRAALKETDDVQS